MKKIFYYLLFLVIVQSCNKETNSYEDLKSITSSYPVFYNDFEVLDNRLKFQNLSEFLNAMENFSDNENNSFSFKNFDEWARINNYVSFRESISKEIDEDVDFVSEDDVLNCLINVNNEVEIGDNIIYFGETFQISILRENYSRTLLEKTIKLRESSIDEGVLFNYYDKFEPRDNCGTSSQCTVHDSNDDYKVSGYWGVSGYASPVWVWSESGAPVHLGWNFGCVFRFTMESYKRNWRGKWKKNHDHDLTFSTGYSTPCNSSGTGWTQNSWRIQRSKVICSGFVSPTEGYDLNCYFTRYHNEVRNSTIGFGCEEHCGN